MFRNWHPDAIEGFAMIEFVIAIMIGFGMDWIVFRALTRS